MLTVFSYTDFFERGGSKMEWEKELGKNLEDQLFSSNTDSVEGVKSYLTVKINELNDTLKRYSGLESPLVHKVITVSLEEYTLYNVNDEKKALRIETGSNFVKISKINTSELVGAKDVAIIETRNKGPQSVDKIGSKISWYDSKIKGFTEKSQLKKEMIDDILEHVFYK